MNSSTFFDDASNSGVAYFETTSLMLSSDESAAIASAISRAAVAVASTDSFTSSGALAASFASVSAFCPSLSAIAVASSVSARLLPACSSAALQNAASCASGSATAAAESDVDAESVVCSAVSDVDASDDSESEPPHAASATTPTKHSVKKIPLARRTRTASPLSGLALSVEGQGNERPHY